MIFISYYTPGDYEKVINTHLLPSLDKFKLTRHIERLESRGNWYKNTSYKPEFIKKCLVEFKKDVCFLDADAEIRHLPGLLDRIPDIFPGACHWLNWIQYWRNKKGGNKFELLSGTLLFKYNKLGLELVDKYVDEVKKNSSMWEQKVLQNIVEKDKYQFYNLPASYCAIKNHGGNIPAYIGEPIIIHHQASRKFKK